MQERTAQEKKEKRSRAREKKLEQEGITALRRDCDGQWGGEENKKERRQRRQRR